MREQSLAVLWEAMPRFPRVEDKRVEVIITKRGQRVAKLVSLADEPPRPLLGYLRGTVAVTGDIMQPVGDLWDADHDGK